MANNKARLVLHFVGRLCELALLYGHFLGALFFASGEFFCFFESTPGSLFVWQITYNRFWRCMV